VGCTTRRSSISGSLVPEAAAPLPADGRGEICLLGAFRPTRASAIAANLESS